MNYLPDIPLEPNGIAFCEFTSPDPVPMAKQLLALGFVAAARCEEATLFRQGNAAFVINSKEGGHAAEHRRRHGTSVSATALRVASIANASRVLLARGARLVGGDALYPGSTAFEGPGGALLYLVEEDPFSRWEEFGGWREDSSRRGCGLDDVCHLVCSPRAEHQIIRLGSFTPQRGLESRPLSGSDVGIEHIVFRTSRIDMTIEQLRANGVILRDRGATSGECCFRGEDERIGSTGNSQVETENLFGSISFGIAEHNSRPDDVALGLPADVMAPAS